MYIPFNDLKDSSRVWIFLSSQVFSDDQVTYLEKRCREFIESWTAHKQDLAASGIVFEHLFLVIAVDESVNDASGCSLDSLFNFVKQEEKATGIRLLDRLQVAVKRKGSEPEIFSLAKAEEAISSGELHAETPVYDVTVNSISQFRSRFLVPLRQTWLQRYLVNA